MNCLDIVSTQIDRIEGDIVAYRRHIHAHPETGFDTGETEAFVKDILTREGIEVLPSTVGVVGLIPASAPDAPYVALRADMDALALEEKNDVPYRSRVPGKMHACGHDGHTAMLLGAARVLASAEIPRNRNVLLVFQPAEEGPNLGGARIMVKDFEEQGLLPKIRAIGALHLSTEYDAGAFGVRYGAAMSSTDEFNVKITGVGGHCGLPHKAIDPISIGAKFVTGMESCLSRTTDPFDPAVFSVGAFHAGTARNVISETAELTGTLRAQSEENRARILEAAENMLKGLALYTKAQIDFDVLHGLPVLLNDDATTALAERIAGRIAGREGVAVLKKSNMGAEDFAYFAQKIPAVFLWLGARNESKGFVHMIHNPQFDIDESALAVGAKFLSLFAMEAD